MAEIKPCPFCGKTPKVHTLENISRGRLWIGKIVVCLCRNKSGGFITAKQAIDFWNRRSYAERKES